MDEILKKILDELKQLKEGQNRIEKKLDFVYDHIAKLTEDMTEVNMNLNKISDVLTISNIKNIKLKKICLS